MGLLTLILTYFKSVIRLSICGYAIPYVVEILILSFLNICLLYIYYHLNHQVKCEDTNPDINPEIANELKKLLDDDYRVQGEYQKEYNFLKDNTRSLSTLFENCIQKKISQETLMRQLEASSESTFFGLRSRVTLDMKKNFTIFPNDLMEKLDITEIMQSPSLTDLLEHPVSAIDMPTKSETDLQIVDTKVNNEYGDSHSKTCNRPSPSPSSCNL